MVIIGPFYTKHIESVRTNHALLFRDRSLFIAWGGGGGGGEVWGGHGFLRKKGGGGGGGRRRIFGGITGFLGQKKG